MILKEKLLNIFHKNEKKYYIELKNYFNKLYCNSLLKKENNKLFAIIHNENININKNNNNYIKSKLKKLITRNIISKNNIIAKSILKQWNLRTKLISMKTIIDKEEKYNKNINSNENSIKHRRINNSKKDNIIKGIKKLNDIFITYRNVDKPNDGNSIHKKEVKDSLNPIINNNDMNNISIKNENENENILNKVNEDNLKYKNNDYWIIEEKEEEQVEEKGESTSDKNDTDM